MAKTSVKQIQADKWLILIQLVIAFAWLKSGWGKFSSPGFMSNISQTMANFAAKTPYEWYGSFLDSFVLPNAELFGNLVRYGEVLTGTTLVIGGLWLLVNGSYRNWAGALVLVALISGFLLNFNFYFASGWSGASTEGVNLVMGLVQLVLVLYYGRYLSRLVRAKK